MSSQSNFCLSEGAPWAAANRLRDSRMLSTHAPKGRLQLSIDEVVHVHGAIRKMVFHIVEIVKELAGHWPPRRAETKLLY